jgi:hypothetical protein
MKMATRFSLLVVFTSVHASFGTAAVNHGKAGGLRGQRKDDPQVQSVQSHYFGLHFDDSPFAVNPWVTVKSARVVDDLEPVAPYDRMDRTLLPSWSGAAQVEPGTKYASVGYTQPDFVPPYLHPRPFPNEVEVKQPDGIMIPLEDQTVVAHEDRLRLPGMDRAVLDPLGMYPLVAPADKISHGPWPIASIDAVPAHYEKFFDQTMKRDAERRREKDLIAAFKRVDKDNDQAISSDEYDAEVKGRQKKTDEQAQTLWKQYHVSAEPDMNQEEFEKMAKTGFDLGTRFVNRSDMSGIITPPQSAKRGDWGGGAACPDGKYITGVQIKVKPNADTGDNTALNCVKFKCDDGTEIQTAEGPEGEWSDWAECEPDQKIFALSVRVQAYRIGQDNSGINDLMFQCRPSGQDTTTTLMFGDQVKQKEEQQGYVFVNGKYVKRSETTVDDKKVVVAKAKVAGDGGWSEELTCGNNGALCGAQGRLSNVEGAKDNMGITDFRFFCCSHELDCTEPCKEATSTSCKACQVKEANVGR